MLSEDELLLQTKARVCVCVCVSVSAHLEELDAGQKPQEMRRDELRRVE